MKTLTQPAPRRAVSLRGPALALLALCAVLHQASLRAQSPGPAVPDPALLGSWHGTDHFFGLNAKEASPDRAGTPFVETALTISAEGKVEGHVGGAQLEDCVLNPNRGWLGRLLHIKTDYILQGKIVGSVCPGSEGGVHDIRAPFDREGDRLDGSIFVMPGTLASPYPFLRLQLERQ